LHHHLHRIELRKRNSGTHPVGSESSEGGRALFPENSYGDSRRKVLVQKGGDNGRSQGQGTFFRNIPEQNLPLPGSGKHPKIPGILHHCRNGKASGGDEANPGIKRLHLTHPSYEMPLKKHRGTGTHPPGSSNINFDLLPPTLGMPQQHPGRKKSGGGGGGSFIFEKGLPGQHGAQQKILSLQTIHPSPQILSGFKPPKKGDPPGPKIEGGILGDSKGKGDSVHYMPHEGKMKRKKQQKTGHHRRKSPVNPGVLYLTISSRHGGNKKASSFFGSDSKS
jgi:hypothetical protein